MDCAHYECSQYCTVALSEKWRGPCAFEVGTLLNALFRIHSNILFARYVIEMIMQLDTLGGVKIMADSIGKYHFSLLW